MKKTIPFHKIPFLSFPDFEVLSMTVKTKEKEIKIDLDGALLAEHSVKLLGPGFLLFKHWKSISIKQFSRNEWIFTQDLLRDICEFSCEENSFILRGFGKASGYWTEYIISESTVEAQFNYKKLKE